MGREVLALMVEEEGEVDARGGDWGLFNRREN